MYIVVDVDIFDDKITDSDSRTVGGTSCTVPGTLVITSSTHGGRRGYGRDDVISEPMESNVHIPNFGDAQVSDFCRKFFDFLNVKLMENRTASMETRQMTSSPTPFLSSISAVAYSWNIVEISSWGLRPYSDVCMIYSFTVSLHRCRESTYRNFREVSDTIVDRRYARIDAQKDHARSRYKFRHLYIFTWCDVHLRQHQFESFRTHFFGF